MEIVPDQRISYKHQLIRGHNQSGDPSLIHIYSAITADGGTHFLGPTSGSAILGGTTSESIDGTGIRFERSIQTMIDRDGVRYAPFSGPGIITPIAWTDPNGNQIITDENGWHDTLGRLIPGSVPTDGTLYGAANKLIVGVPAPDLNYCPPLTKSARLWNLPAFGGGTASMKVCYGDFFYSTNFGHPGVFEAQGFARLINAIVLPNLTKWQFEYNNYGDLVSVSFPTGGSITYTWATDPVWERVVTARTIDANDGTGPHTWNYQWNVQFINGSFLNVVTDPSGNDTTNLVFLGYVTETKSYSGSYTSGTLLKTVTTQYRMDDNPFAADIDGSLGPSNVVPLSVTTTLPNGKVSQTAVPNYDSGFTYFHYNMLMDTNDPYQGIYGLPLSQTSSDYGQGAPGAIVNQTATTYQWQNNSNYLTANMLNLPAAVIEQDSSGTRVAETDFTYDDPARLVASNISTQHVAPPAAVRGNVSSVSKWLNTSGCNPQIPGSCPTSYTNIFDTGMLFQSIDPLSRTTTFTYDPGFAGAYVTQTQMPDTSGIHHIISGNYDFSTGLLTSLTNQNGNTSGYSYDSMSRITQVDFADGGQKTYSYNDDLTAFPMVYVMETTKMDSSNVTRTWTGFDGMGRKVRFAKYNGEGTANMFDMTDTCYDALGRVSVQNYPFQGAGWSPNPINCAASTGDSFTYDALGRTTQVTHSDGSHVNTDYSQIPVVTVSDEAGKQRRNQADALGRLTTVWEPDATGAFSYETDYQYDALDNLLRVDQKGGDSNSANWRTRTFAYNSLSRLLSATNPESGTITYAYDDAGNLTSKTAPAPNQTGSATVTTTYTYDQLNRLATQTFSTGGGVVHVYDQSNQWGVNIENPIGRLTAIYNFLPNINQALTVTTATSYDVMGRPKFQRTWNWRSNGAPTQDFNYTYNLDGSLKTLQYPSGRTITYSYNVGQRPVSAVDVANGINYYTDAHYTAFGAPKSMVYGSTPSFAGISWNNTYNSRMQPVFLTATTPTSTVFSLGYDFHLNSDDNGNVYAVNNNKIADHGRDQSFTYDQLNRLLTAQSAATSGPNCWGESFGYDPWGNLINRSVTKCTAEGSVPSANAKNQMNGNAYDAAGNLLTGSYTYDAENRLLTSPGVTYDYDPDGRRVQKSDGTLYWYDTGSSPLQETDLSGTLKEEYIFFGGKRIARREDGAFLSSATMQNGSFSQANPLDQPPCLCYNFGPIPGWTSTGAQTGSWQPSTASYNAPLPGIVVYSNGGTISQTLATGLQPNTTYTLLVDVGHRLEGGINNYSLTLQADSTVLATNSGSNGTISPGSFQTQTLTYTTGSAPPAGNVTIVLTSFGPQINFKNVRLNLSSVGAVHYYFADHLGSTDIVTNATGIPEEERELYPYGGERVILDTGIGNNYKFTGKERDPETGLDEFGARYYSSALGRFTTVDPKQVSKRKMFGPQEWNMYSYAMDNPLKYVDPDGKAAELVLINNSHLSNTVVQQAGYRAAQFFHAHGVKNAQAHMSKYPALDEVRSMANKHVVIVNVTDSWLATYGEPGRTSKIAGWTGEINQINVNATVIERSTNSVIAPGGVSVPMASVIEHETMHTVQSTQNPSEALFDAHGTGNPSNLMDEGYDFNFTGTLTPQQEQQLQNQFNVPGEEDTAPSPPPTDVQPNTASPTASNCEGSSCASQPANPR